jgi:hypothetical protein
MGGRGNCIVVSKTRLHRETGTWNKSGVYTQFIRQTGGYGSRDTALGITSSLLSTPRERESIFGVFLAFQLELETSTLNEVHM